MRCRTGCMSVAKPAQSFAGSRRTTRSEVMLGGCCGGLASASPPACGAGGSLLTAADGALTSAARSEDTLLVVEVGGWLIAVLTIPAAYAARSSNGREHAASIRGHWRESPAARSDRDSMLRWQAL